MRTLVDCDSAVSMAENMIPSSRSSHIHMRFFYVRQLHDEDIIILERIDTKDQLADLLVTYKNTPNFDRLMHLSLLEMAPTFPATFVIGHQRPTNKYK